MESFTKIVQGLDVAPTLAGIAARPEDRIRLGADDQQTIPLLSATGERIYEAEHPEAWKLIDHVLAILDADHDDSGRLCHCRIGVMPPGCGLPPHVDGVDGINERRYQLSLASEPGAMLTVGGEGKCFRPGEVWRIDVSRIHSVRNDSAADRITILFDTAG
jgi:aspartyl/asparaginyl beta-hydroxylase (cupin superfamily)